MKAYSIPSTESVLLRYNLDIVTITNFINVSVFPNTTFIPQNLVYRGIRTNKETAPSILGLPNNAFGIMMYSLQTKDSAIRLRLGQVTQTLDNVVNGYVNTSLEKVIFQMCAMQSGSAVFNYHYFEYV